MINAEQIIKQCFDLAIGMYPANTSSAEDRNAYQISLLETKLREVVAMHNRIVPAGRAHMRDMPSPAADGTVYDASISGMVRRAPIEKTAAPAEERFEPNAVTEADFRAAWATMEAKGYRYGDDALDNVRVGFNLGVDWVYAKS